MPSYRLTIAALTLFGLCLLAGCVTLPPIPGDKDLITTVTAVGTSREAILLKLGEPSASFETGRILTYRIGEDEEQGYFLMDRQVRWTNIKYSLVLVFDDQGRLTKHSLVKVR